MLTGPLTRPIDVAFLALPSSCFLCWSLGPPPNSAPLLCHRLKQNTWHWLMLWRRRSGCIYYSPLLRCHYHDLSLSCATIKVPWTLWILSQYPLTPSTSMFSIISFMSTYYLVFLWWLGSWLLRWLLTLSWNLSPLYFMWNTYHLLVLYVFLDTYLYFSSLSFLVPFSCPSCSDGGVLALFVITFRSQLCVFTYIYMIPCFLDLSCLFLHPWRWGHKCIYLYHSQSLTYDCVVDHSFLGICNTQPSLPVGL